MSYPDYVFVLPGLRQAQLRNKVNIALSKYPRLTYSWDIP